MSRIFLGLGLGLACALMGGCANVKPWEREMLSDPIMGVNGGAARENLMEKFYSTREGGMGGPTGVGGGCGCSK
jgi:hypothetical protein